MTTTFARILTILVVTGMAAVHSPQSLAQNTVDWGVWRVVPPSSTTMTLNIDGDQRFGINRAGQSEGVFLGSRKAYREQVKFARSGITGSIVVFEIETTWTDDTTASSRLSYFPETRDLPFDRTSNGSFSLQNIEYRWVRGKLQSKEGIQDCNVFTSGIARSSLVLFGYYCSSDSSTLTESRLQDFVAAIGYKQLKVARPVTFTASAPAPTPTSPSATTTAPIGQPPQPPGAPAASSNVEDRLAQIKRLLDRGLMTPAEYEQKRKEIISGI